MKAIAAKRCDVEIDEAGAIFLLLSHPCGCCATFAQLDEAEADALIGLLESAKLSARAQKGGRLCAASRA